MHSKTALKEYIKRAQQLSRFMTHSDQLVRPSKEFLDSLEKDNKFLSKLFIRRVAFQKNHIEESLR